MTVEKVLRGQSAALNAYVRKEETFKINYLNFDLGKLKKRKLNLK